MSRFVCSSFRTGGIARGISRLWSPFGTGHVAVSVRFASVAVDLSKTMVSCVSHVTTSVTLGVWAYAGAWWRAFRPFCIVSAARDWRSGA